MPRARSRSSVMASLALRWAASTSSSARSRSASAIPAAGSRARRPACRRASPWPGPASWRPPPSGPARRRAGPARSGAAARPSRPPRGPGSAPARAPAASAAGRAAWRPASRPRCWPPSIASGAQTGHRAPAGTRAKETAREWTAGHQHRVRRPPGQPPRHLDHHAEERAGSPTRSGTSGRRPRRPARSTRDHGEHRERQLEQQVGTGPPADRIGQPRPDPAEERRAAAAAAAAVRPAVPAAGRPGGG